MISQFQIRAFVVVSSCVVLLMIGGCRRERELEWATKLVHNDVTVNGREGSVIVSSNAIEVLKSYNVITDESASFFVPTMKELELADEALHTFAVTISERRYRNPQLFLIWLGHAQEVLDHWDEYFKVFVGYRTSNSRYVFINCKHRNMVDWLESNYYRGVWKDYILIFSDDPRPQNVYSPSESINLSTGHIDQYMRSD